MKKYTYEITEDEIIITLKETEIFKPITVRKPIYKRWNFDKKTLEKIAVTYAKEIMCNEYKKYQIEQVKKRWNK